MKFLVVDDHPLIREAMVAVLGRLDAQAVVRTAPNADEGLAIAHAEPDLEMVLLDLNMPGQSGVDAVRAWRAALPDLPVVVLSSTEDRATILAAIGAGAAGFIPKSAASDVMVGALRLILAGGKYLPPEALLADGGTAAPRQRPARALSVESLGLTDRQLEVLRAVAAGKPNKIISSELDLAERTVKAHITAVMRALGVTSRTQAALAAARLGLATRPEKP